MDCPGFDFRQQKEVFPFFKCSDWQLVSVCLYGILLITRGQCYRDFQNVENGIRQAGSEEKHKFLSDLQVQNLDDLDDAKKSGHWSTKKIFR